MPHARAKSGQARKGKVRARAKGRAGDNNSKEVERLLKTLEEDKEKARRAGKPYVVPPELTVARISAWHGSSFTIEAPKVGLVNILVKGNAALEDALKQLCKNLVVLPESQRPVVIAVLPPTGSKTSTGELIAILDAEDSDAFEDLGFALPARWGNPDDDDDMFDREGEEDLIFRAPKGGGGGGEARRRKNEKGEEALDIDEI